MAKVALLLQTYTNDICSENYEQIKEVLQALIEMCVGNAANQQVILDKQVVDSINHILQHGNFETKFRCHSGETEVCTYLYSHLQL